MLRRSFRVGLRLGLLAGVAFALVKLAQSRRAGDEAGLGASGDAWPPIQPDPVAVEPPAPTVTDRIPPVRRTPVEPEASAPAPVDGAEPAAEPLGAATPATAAPASPGPAGQAPPLGAVIPPPEEPAPPHDAPGHGAEQAPPPGQAGPPKAAEASKASKASKKAAGKRPPADGSTPSRPTARSTTRVRKARRQTWVEPVDREAPASHPVKAKLSSMLYHLPGMALYNRTNPDRCYADAEAAEADGFTRAKR